MPLIFKEKVLDHATVAVWKIEEEESFFLNQHPSVANSKELKKLKGGRRQEWLASRYLLQSILPKSYSIGKDRYGKPELLPKDFLISISHSHGYVAAITSKKSVGIDIQKKVSKISRIAHKFISPPESEFIQGRSFQSYLHIIWGAKECLFKAYGRKKVDFKENLFIEPFKYRKCGAFSGSFKKKNQTSTFNFENRLIKSFYLVYCEEI